MLHSVTSRRILRIVCFFYPRASAVTMTSHTMEPVMERTRWIICQSPRPRSLLVITTVVVGRTSHHQPFLSISLPLRWNSKTNGRPLLLCGGISLLHLFGS
uniref:Putative secreted protein n=1 Tax=Anopheles darlingi TaxID=43151 RepID=A0A2M4D880_ANODA